MEDERLLAVMATPIHIPAVVDRSHWPVHVTIAGNFRLDDASLAQIPALLDRLATDVVAFDAVLGPSDEFGTEHNIPVLLAQDPAFQRLHERLAAALGELPGFEAAEPAFWGDGYRPHATLGPSVDVRDGDTLPIRILTLVSLDTNAGTRISAVELS